MLRDITFGKYYNTQSVLHRLDGRVNFLRFVVFIVSVFIAKNPQCFVFATLFLLITILISNIPLGYILKGVWGVRYYVLLCIGLSLISDFSSRGLVKSLFLCVKLVMLITSASMFTLTTSISHISDTFEWLLTPLKCIGVPVRDVAVMLSIAIRFLPVLAEEAEHILYAQRARGAKIGFKNTIPLIIPIFASAIRRASDLSDALKARAYGAYNKRSRLNPLKFKEQDLFAIIVLVLYLGIIVWVNGYAS